MTKKDSDPISSFVLPFLLGAIVGSNKEVVKKCLEPLIKGSIESIFAFSKAFERVSGEQKEWLEDIVAESKQVDEIDT